MSHVQCISLELTNCPKGKGWSCGVHCSRMSQVFLCSLEENHNRSEQRFSDIFKLPDHVLHQKAFKIEIFEAPALCLGPRRSTWFLTLHLLRCLLTLYHGPCPWHRVVLYFYRYVMPVAQHVHVCVRRRARTCRLVSKERQVQVEVQECWVNPDLHLYLPPILLSVNRHTSI